jgi:hypothetical protein
MKGCRKYLFVAEIAALENWRIVGVGVGVGVALGSGIGIGIAIAITIAISATVVGVRGRFLEKVCVA